MTCSRRRGQISTVCDNGRFSNNYTQSTIDRVAWILTSLFFSLCYVLAIARASHNILEQMATTISLGNTSAFRAGRRYRCGRKGGNNKGIRGFLRCFLWGGALSLMISPHPLTARNSVATFPQVCLRRSQCLPGHMAMESKTRVLYVRNKAKWMRIHNLREPGTTQKRGDGEITMFSDTSKTKLKVGGGKSK